MPNKKENNIVYTGTVCYISPKGFGFIQTKGAPPNRGVYFHAKAVVAGTRFDDIAVGDTVRFTKIIKTARGLIANSVLHE